MYKHNQHFFNISDFLVFASPAHAAGVLVSFPANERATDDIGAIAEGEKPGKGGGPNFGFGNKIKGLEGRPLIRTFESPNDDCCSNNDCCNKVPALFLNQSILVTPVCPPIQGGIGFVFKKRPKPKFKVLVTDGAGNTLEKKLCLTETSDQVECFPPKGSFFVGFTSEFGIVEIKISDIANSNTAIIYTVIGERICPPDIERDDE